MGGAKRKREGTQAPIDASEQHENEAFVAAHLGFSSTESLRRFILSHFFLYFYLKFDGPWSHNLDQETVTGRIREFYLKEENKRREPTPFPLDNAQISMHHPGVVDQSRPLYQNELGRVNKSRIWYAAHLLILLVAEVDDVHAVLNGEIAPKRSRTEGRINIGIQDITNLAEVEWPCFKTGAEIEMDIEPYNKAMLLILYARHRFQPSKILELQTSVEGVRVGPAPEKQLLTADDDQGPPIQSASTLASTKFVIMWRRKGQSKAKQQELNTCIRADEDREPPAKLRSSSDPRIYSPAKYRDSVRRDFKCFERRLQISRLRWQRPGIATETEPDPEDIDHDLLTCDWDDFKEDLERFEGQDVVIAVSFEPMAEEMVSEEDIYECMG